MLKRTVVTVGLVVALFGLTAAQAAAKELRVSKDLTCGTYPTIQSAVDASGPGDTVAVCPGNYSEQVRIVGHNHDGLKLVSVKSQQATIQWPQVESFPFALVDINNADRVRVDGFVISGPFTFPACAPDRHEGVLIDNAFNEQISENHITQIRNSVPSLTGCQEGDAVAIGRRTAGAPPNDSAFPLSSGSASVEDNVIDAYQKNGVQIVNKGSAGDVQENRITGFNQSGGNIAAPNGVVVFDQAAATIERNEISHNNHPAVQSTGILITSGSAPGSGPPKGAIEISGNYVHDNDLGIEMDSTSGQLIDHNAVTANVTDGIQLCGDTTQGCAALSDTKVLENATFGNHGSGIDLIGATNNLLGANEVARNGNGTGDTTDGLRVDKNSTGNTIRSNRMRQNVTHDCHDDSAGTGTAGTANTWKDNQGQTQNRPGLCRPKDGSGDHGDQSRSRSGGAGDANATVK